MKAVVCLNEKLTFEDLPEPEPGPGQVLLEVLRCGICGSDLHLRHNCDHMKALAGRVGYGEQFPCHVRPDHGDRGRNFRNPETALPAAGLDPVARDKAAEVSPLQTTRQEDSA